MRGIATAAITLLAMITIVLSGESFCASNIDAIQVLKISGSDQRAVIKDIDGKTKLIKPGDPIGKTAKIVEIAAGRVVIEEKAGNQAETVIIRLEDGKQRVERIRKTGEKQPPLYSAKAPKEQKGWSRPMNKKEKGKKDKAR